MIRTAVVVILICFAAWAALAHDQANWIQKNGHKNPAGEWCCGEGDCFIVPNDQINLLYEGYLFGMS